MVGSRATPPVGVACPFNLTDRGIFN